MFSIVKGSIEVFASRVRERKFFFFGIESSLLSKHFCVVTIRSNPLHIWN